MKRIIAITLALLMSFSCFSLISFAEETATAEHLTEVPEGYVGIYNKDDLDNIKLDMSGKYILMNDIVFEDSDYVKGGSFYNSGKGWEPIGTTSTSFKGILDGNGYRIKNLYINNPTQDCIGLFGYVNGATITKVSLENVNITGKDYVGGIVGYSYGEVTVSYCNIQGTIDGEDYVGGVVGYQNSYVNLSKIYNYVKFCSNSASVTAKSNVGGIVGYSYSFCYSISDYAYSYVQCCYNVGNISGTSYVGGLVGGFDSYYKHSYVIHSYSLGNITATSNYGGCFGKVPYSYSFCYYLDECVDNPTCTAGIPKSEDQFKKASTFEQWDFKTIWTTKGREDYPYPEIIGSYPILPEDGKHKHEYTSEITIPATHTAEGVMTYTCECGDSYTETIEKSAEHNYIEEITTPATHMAEGVMTFTCDCGDTYTETIKKITAHNFEATVTEPTCTEHGFTTFVCECGETYTRDYVSAIGHKHTAVTTDPTCTEEGFTTYTCDCGDSYVENYVDATGHIDEDGDYICDNGCGYEFEKTEPETPDEPENDEEEKPCDCNCHKGGITAFLFKLINFFAKLFDSSAKTCKCGAKH